MRISAFTDILPEGFDEAFGVLTGEIGLRAIDLRSRIGAFSVDTLPRREAERIARRAGEAGVAVTCVASWGVHGLGGGEEQRGPAYREEIRQRVRHLCETARIVGAANVRVYAMYRPEGFDAWPGARQEALRRENAGVLRGLCDIAAEYERTLVIENEPPTLCATTGEMADLMARVDHPAAGLNWDIVNGWRAGEYPWPARYELIRGHVRQVHIKGAVAGDGGGFGSFAIPGEDGFPHQAILRSVRADGAARAITIDPHYPQFDERFKLHGDPEPVRTVVSRTLSFIEGVLEDHA